MSKTITNVFFFNFILKAKYLQRNNNSVKPLNYLNDKNNNAIVWLLVIGKVSGLTCNWIAV